LIIFLFCFFPILSGCGPKSHEALSVKTVYDLDIKNNYHKKIGIIFSQNDQLSEDVDKELLNFLIEDIKDNCKNVSFILPDNALYPDFLSNPPQLENGEIDTFSLSNYAKRDGYDMVMDCSFLEINVLQKEKGALWFKNEQSYIRAHSMVTIYDTYTCVKLLSENSISEVKITESDADTFKTSGTIPDKFLDEVIKNHAESFNKKVCDSINTSHWKCEIISVAGKKVRISRGKTSGILEGDIFEVFDIGHMIENIDNQKFLVPGYKIGEIEISKVFGDKAEGVLLSETPIKEGDIAFPKT